MSTAELPQPRRRHRAYLSLGSNIGDRRGALAGAIEAIAADPQIDLIAQSSLYATPPVGYIDQPDFLNAAAAIDTDLEPEGLLHLLKSIESNLGRRQRLRWREREIDIDILLFDERVVHTPALVLPHPEMEHRGFVLVPLAEIAPHACHPLLNLTAEALRDRLSGDLPFQVVAAPDDWRGE